MSTNPAEPPPIDFDALVPTHQSRVVSVARRILGSRKATENVTQEAFPPLFHRPGR